MRDFQIKGPAWIDDARFEITAKLPGGTTAPDGRPIFSEPSVSLSDAIRKYGLKIEKRKAPIEMLTVTHLERMPTEN